MPLYRVFGSEKKLQAFRSGELKQKYQEKDLEDWIERNPEVLLGNEPLLIVGRQVNTPVGTIDLLGLDSSGSGVIIELKRAPSQRAAVSQALEYASWLAEQTAADLTLTAETYLRRSETSSTLQHAWEETFASELDPGNLNQSQRIFVLIEGEDERTESMVRYLRSFGIDFSLLRYNFYRTDAGEEILHLEQQVGETEADHADKIRHSEANLLKNWTQNEIDTYQAFKEELLSSGLYPQAKKSGMSFLAQTQKGDVFVCFFSTTSDLPKIWIRHDSMRALIDFDKASEAIKAKAPQDFRFSLNPTWFMIRFPASQDSARQAASLVMTELVRRLIAE